MADVLLVAHHTATREITALLLTSHRASIPRARSLIARCRTMTIARRIGTSRGGTTAIET
jgi:DNA-binding phage protein